MLKNNKYIILENKNDFVANYNNTCGSFYGGFISNRNGEVKYDDDASYPIALKYEPSYWPHSCDEYVLVSLDEACENILKTNLETIEQLTEANLKLKQLI